MLIEATEVDIEYGYAPRTELAVKFRKTASGKYIVSNRPISEDIYYSTFTVIGTHSNVGAIEDVLFGLKNDPFNITLSEGEEIFGADVAPGTYSVVLMSKTPISTSNFSLSSMTLNVVLQSTPVFQGTPDPTNLLFPYIYEGDRNYERVAQVSIDGTASTTDEDYTTNRYKASFTMIQEEMADLRRFISTNRGAIFTLPAMANVYPFGRNIPGPWDVRIVDWEDGGRSNQKFWGLTLTMVQH